MQVSVRQDVPVAMLSFFTQIPGMGNQQTETCRVVTTTAHVKKMIDVLCKSMDYWPDKKTAKSIKKKKPK